MGKGLDLDELGLVLLVRRVGMPGRGPGAKTTVATHVGMTLECCSNSGKRVWFLSGLALPWFQAGLQPGKGSTRPPTETPTVVLLRLAQPTHVFPNVLGIDLAEGLA